MSYYYANKLIYKYFENQKNFGSLQNADITLEAKNPICGDQVKIQIVGLDKGLIKEIKHVTKGCVVAQAFASLTTEYVRNKTIDFVDKIKIETLEKIVGTTFGPNRIECAQLALKTIQEGLESVRSDKSCGDFIKKGD